MVQISYSSERSFARLAPFIAFIVVAITSCSGDSEGKKTDLGGTAKRAFKHENIEVVLADISQGVFSLEIISNGKSMAMNNAEIAFPMTAQILSVQVKNGDRVRKGQLMATLDATEIHGKMERTKEALAKASVDLDDRLIDYGYRLKDSSKVPVDIMRMAKVKSGYNAVRYDYSDLTASIEKTRVRAPFSGKVADVEARPFNNTQTFKKLCTLIDDSQMKVEFSILETEFHFLSLGSVLEITPFGGGKTLTGRVTQINPLIDANGMIRITGIVQNTGGELIDGMSIRIVSRRSVSGKLFVPKEALVERDGREVVFTFEGGRAKWNYVETDLRNSRYVCIKSGLMKGQKVIISNNINLAHDSEVTAATGGGSTL